MNSISPSQPLEQYSLQLGAEGCLVLPVALQKQLNLKEGDRFILIVEAEITLSQEPTHVLEALVKYGQYSSLEEALNTALLLLIDDVALSNANDNPDYLAWVHATRQKIHLAREQAQRGEVLNAEDVLAQLRNKVQQARERTV